MHRVYNFSPGPATLPTEVLEQAREELLDWHGLGASVMEVSHRGHAFMELAQTTEQALRDLLAIPKNYHVLFMQGGARAQFAMVPLNLLGPGDKGTHRKKADYFNTGVWSKVAITEAQRYTTVNVVTSTKVTNTHTKDRLTTIPEQADWQFDPDAAYVHYVSNETIDGIEFPVAPALPAGYQVPLTVDMTSNILSEPIDINKFSIIYAGAQKNMGIAGLTVAIVRDDILDRALPFTPTLYNYRTYVDSQSLYNTPPTFPWYMASLVFEWLKRQGGLSAMATLNQRKSQAVYACIDNSEFYRNTVDPAYRSRMNVVFRLKDESLNRRFLEESEAAGLVGLKGHALIGGMRASLYNAMPEEGVDTLVDFMQDFAERYG